jgi:hypothetical protein
VFCEYFSLFVVIADLLDLIACVTFNMIVTLLASSSTNTLLNGSHGPKIWHARGLRQGDALSSMLFILVMDALCLLFNKVKEEGFLTHINEGQSIPQRLSVFADDLILFLRETADDAKTANYFWGFWWVFGPQMQFSMAKNNILAIYCNVDPVSIIYLGLPLHFQKACKEYFQGLIDGLCFHRPLNLKIV